MAIGNPVSTTSSSVASKTSSVIATAGQTLFTVPAGYVTNHISVFRNGIRLVDGRDYEARNGATVTLLAAATVGDVIEFHVFDTFSVADAVTNQGGTIFGNLTVEGSIGDITANNVTGVAATFTGAVSVGGVLTYEDVTNVDSVGIITARSDLSIADKIIHTGDTNTAIRFPAADTFTVETGGSEAFRVDSSQRLILGATSAIDAGTTSLIQAVNAGGARIVLARNDTSTAQNDSIGRIRFYGNDSDGNYDECARLDVIADADHTSTSKASALTVHTTASGAESPTERLRITSAGNMGLGTNNPTSDGGTTLEIYNATTPTLKLNDGGDYKGLFQLRGNDLEIRGSSGVMEFYTGNADGASSSVRMTIDSVGRLLLGTTTVATNATVTVRATSPQLSLYATPGNVSRLTLGDTDDHDIGQIGYDNSDNSMRFTVNASERLRIDSSGRLLLNSGTDVRIELGTTGTTGTNNRNHLRGDGSSLKFNTCSGGLHIFEQNGTERLRIDSSGRLLMGSSVAGNADADNINVAGAGNVGMTFRGSNSGTGNIFFADNTSGDDLKRGQIVYDHSSNSMRFHTNATEKLRIDSSGNIAIGTISASSRLHVKGAADSYLTLQAGTTDGNDGVLFQNSGGTQKGALLYDTDDNYLLFNVNSAERMRIDSSGNMGLGTTPHNNAGTNLHIHGSNTTAELRLTNTTTGTGANGAVIQQGGNTLYISNSEAGNIAIENNGSERMRITSSGLFGMGYSVAAAHGLLTLAQAASSSFNALVVQQGNTGYTNGDGLHIGIDTAVDAYMIHKENRALYFGTANTERMRITSGGNIQITDPNNSTGVKSKISFVTESPYQDEVAFIGFNRTATSGAPCDIVFNTGNASGNQERMRLTNNGNLTINNNAIIGSGILSFPFYGQTQNGLVIQSTWNGSNASYVVIKNHSGTTIGTITASTTATSFNTSSDYRLKENVVDITNGITRVKQLSPKRFNFIDDADTTVDGFLAHEAQTVVPEAVTGTHNEVDDDGNAVMQCIDQTKLVPLLTAALQEAIAEIESLKARVATLEG